jgi:hypothetical protein
MHCERERAHCESVLQGHCTTWRIAKGGQLFRVLSENSEPGDVLNVTRLDRPARSLRERLGGNQSSPRTIDRIISNLKETKTDAH